MPLEMEEGHLCEVVPSRPADKGGLSEAALSHHANEGLLCEAPLTSEPAHHQCDTPVTP